MASPTGHAVNGKAWKDNAGNVKYLITDFQRHVGEPGRFHTELPSADFHYVITTEQVRGLAEMAAQESRRAGKAQRG